MRGIATIDRQSGSGRIAIWVTNRTGIQVVNTNAVTIEPGTDPDATAKIRSLTRRCAVLVTEGSTLENLPIEGEPLTKDDIEAMLAATKARQKAIVNAVLEHRSRTRSSSLTIPHFQPSPVWADYGGTENTPAQYAFRLANYLGAAWSRWLETEEERRRRTARPRTGETPWIMPEDLNSPVVVAFPDEFAARLSLQALV